MKKKQDRDLTNKEVIEALQISRAFVEEFRESIKNIQSAAVIKQKLDDFLITCHMELLKRGVK